MDVKKVLYSVNEGTCPSEDRDPFRPSFSKIKTTIDVRDLGADAAAIAIWGGGDIHPSIYNQRNVRSGVGPKASERDLLELSFCEHALEYNIPLIGICRGAQLLCALAGGHLYQHVTDHYTHHMIQLFNEHNYKENKFIMGNSIHHQMMYPWSIPHELIAATATSLSKEYVFDTDIDLMKKPPYEPEIVWFPEIRGLAIQGHPEYMSDSSEFNQFCNQLVRKYIHDK
ncbi:MAG: gamma-glutamyl-gamma-aminobutyrate hydrolase family protein [Patescibacteria group bacterium]